MKLEQFGEELKQVRTEKGISLADISVETRINLKFLEAIEEGRFHILPQTYVRAFLREYALILGLDPVEIVQRYNALLQEMPVSTTETTAKSSLHQPATAAELINKIVSLAPLQRNIIFGAGIVAAIVIVGVIVRSSKQSETTKSVSEVAFDRVVRENEAASLPPPAPATDSILQSAPAKRDSLRLEINTLDSVWISILIDGKKGEEYLFAANRKRIWAAKERFVVTMGNAGGAVFRLNGKDIGPLGKRGAVVRNAVVTEALLKQ